MWLTAQSYLFNFVKINKYGGGGIEGYMSPGNFHQDTWKLTFFSGLLPMREGILYLPCPSGIGIEILTLSVRVSIGMFSAHIKEYDKTQQVSE